MLCVLPAVRRTVWLSYILLVTGARLDAQHLAPRSPSTYSAYSSLPEILVVNRPSLTTLRYPGYAEPFGALLSLGDFLSALTTSRVGTLSGHHGHSSLSGLLIGILLARIPH